MSRFNQGNSDSSLTNGTTNFVGASVSSLNLIPGKPVRADNSQTLVSGQINQSDLSFSVLANPYVGTIQATDFETDEYFSVSEELQKIENLTGSTPNNTNIQGNINCDKVLVEQVFSKTFPSTFIDMDNNQAVDVYASDLTFNGSSVITTATLPPSSNSTFQDTYNSSPTPATTTLLPGKDILFTDGTGVGIFQISEDGKILSGYLTADELTTREIYPVNLGSNIDVIGVGLTAENFTKNGGTANQYLMADGSLTNTDDLNSVIKKTEFIIPGEPAFEKLAITTFVVKMNQIDVIIPGQGIYWCTVQYYSWPGPVHRSIFFLASLIFFLTRPAHHNYNPCQ